MWFKKKSVLQADHHYDTEKSFDGTDWRTSNNNYSWPASQTLPSAADAGNYFYLPALGQYRSGLLYNVIAYFGYYWSSSANPYYSSAFHLLFTYSYVNVESDDRYLGFRVEPTFE